MKLNKDEVTTSLVPAPAHEHMSNSLAVSLARAEVDQQIATARALPRSITRALANIATLATIDEESAKECIYSVPRAGKLLRGASIRFAEIIFSQWGNCRVGARIVHVDRIEKYVEAEGVFHDLETNAATTARVQRRISNKEGQLLNEDMILVASAAAMAIAKRNAITAGVPRPVWRKSYDEIEAVIAGDVKTLAERRDRNLKAFAKYKVTPEQVFEALGVSGVEDIDLEKMITLVGMYSALKNGESSVEELFPKRQKRITGSLTERLDALAAADDAKLLPEDRVPSKEDKLMAPSQERVEQVSKVYGLTGDPPHDPETGEILDIHDQAVANHAKGMADQDPGLVLNDVLDARKKARTGSKRLEEYLQKLSAPAYARVEGHMAELKRLAAEADGNGKG